MQKKKFYKLLLGLLLASMISGCGILQSEENLKEGFASITALEYETALNHFAAAEEAGEDPQVVARGKGIALLGLTRYEEAVESFATALSYSDENLENFDYDTNYYLAAAYYKMGEKARAKDVYSAILGMKEEEHAYYMRGVILLEEGNLNAAKEDFDKALALRKNNYNLQIDVYSALESNGYKDEGKAYLQAALGNADKKMSDYERGRLYYYMEDYETARNYLETAKASGDSQVILLLGKTYEALGDYNYAASIYSNYLADHKEDVIIYNRLGVCKTNAGAYEDALQAFQTALDLQDKTMTQTLLYNRIVVYEHMGDFGQARVLMKEYLTSYPDDEKAKREYEFLQSR